MKTNLIILTSVLSTLFMLGGCSTPSSVTNLAKTTSANISLVNSSTKAYAERNKRSAERRSEYIIDVKQAAVDLDAEYKSRMGALKHAEDKKKRSAGETQTARVEAMLAYLGELDEIETKATTERDLFEKDLKEARKRAGLSNKEMQALAKSLSLLAKEKTAEETLNFLKGFLKETVAGLKSKDDEVEIANEKSEKLASGNAEAMTKEASTSIDEAKEKSK